MLQRLLVSIVAGVAVGFALFLLMHSMISDDQTAAANSGDLKLLDFIQVDAPPDQLRTKDREKPKPPPPPDKPPPPELKVSQDVKPQKQQIRMDMPKIESALGAGTGPFLGSAGSGGSMGGDLIPLVRIEPQYPREAARGKIEGYVKVEFTVLEDGSVTDVDVLESDPPRVFDREAVRAILKWKFKPRIVDGRPVKRRATQTLQFTLPDAYK